MRTAIATRLVKSGNLLLQRARACAPRLTRIFCEYLLTFLFLCVSIVSVQNMREILGFSSIELEYPFSKAYGLWNNPLNSGAFQTELEEISYESCSKMCKMQFSSAPHEHQRHSPLFLPQLLLRNSAQGSRQLTVVTMFLT